MDGGIAAGVEASGISLLQRAVELDTSRRFTESLICYQEGIQLLLDAMKSRFNFLTIAMVHCSRIP